MSFKAVTLAALLAGFSMGSSALVLGKVRGAAWIGQALDVTVAVQLEGAPADRPLCAEVDVFHADSRQDNNRIRISPEPADQPDVVNLRISSMALVDEPVVTLYLRVGCTQKTSRRYVFLADLPDVTAAPASRAAPVVAPTVPTIVATESGSVSTVSEPASPVLAGAGAAPAAVAGGNKVIRVVPGPLPEQPAVTPRSAVPAGKPKPPANARQAAAPKPAAKSPQTSPPPPAKPALADKPRLKLDPLEKQVEKSSAAVAPTPVAPIPVASTPVVAPTPAPAVASSSATAASDTTSLSELSASVKAQLEQSAKSQAQLLALTERLERAESERVPVAVVYLLAALLAVCLGALGVLWSKRNSPVVEH